MSAKYYLKWAREIKQFEQVKRQFSLCGNIYDIYPFYQDGKNIPLPLIDYLERLFEDLNFDLSLSYEPLIGFRYLKGSEDAFQEVCKEVFSINDAKKEQLIEIENIDIAAQNIENIMLCDNYKMDLIIEWGALLPKIAVSEIQLNTFLYRMFRLSYNENIFQNRIVWLLNVDNDLPDWYTLNNMNYKSIIIPKPDFTLRKIVIEAITKYAPGFSSLSTEDIEKYQERFVNQTYDMYAHDIQSIIDICIKEKIDIGNISDIIKKYRFGVIENPWTQLLKEYSKIEKTESFLKERVIGQDEAITKAVDVINRAYFNLSGCQFSRTTQRPKGVLFFAGPTGVGKTELAKAITHYLFGSDTAFIRFDMSEFNHEHADQRLIGAPPGYRGHESGGELTNKVKENPFCVILFDEIEKAHNKIFDKFLQILDDGRITSGKGETVYFSESLIIFTSNLGLSKKEHPNLNKAQSKANHFQHQGRITSVKGETVYLSEGLITFTSNLGLSKKEYPNLNKAQSKANHFQHQKGKSDEDNPMPEDTISDDISYSTHKKRIMDGIDNFFEKDLKRPEIRNRIGKNIIVFDYIRKDAALKILVKMVDNVINQLKETHKVIINKPKGEMLKILQHECTKDLSHGGRGIGNTLEEVFVNPISRELIKEKACENDTYTIVNITQNSKNIWTIDIRKD